MNTPQLADSLRAAVLQAAIKGELTERSSENARDLLAQIQNEKQALQAKGSLKKTKAPAPVSADEVLFDIPENWVWVRLGEIIFLKSGQDLTPSEYSSTPEGIPYITGASHFNNGQLTISRWTKFPKSIAEKGSLLFTCKGTVGEMAFLQEEKVHIARQVMAITSFDGKVELSFIKLILDAYVARIKANAKSMIPGIGRDDLLLLPIPLPPLAEQQAIVEKLTRLLAEIDRLKAEEQSLASLQKAYPQTLRASVLAAAIKGELTERSSENARDLLLHIQNEKQALQAKGSLKKAKAPAPVTADEVPFEIPENWVWVRLGEIGQIISGGTPKTTHSEYWENGDIPWITPADMRSLNSKYIERGARNITKLGLKSSSAQLLPKGSVLFSSRAPIGYVAIAQNEMATNQGFKSVAPFKTEMSEYLYFVLLALKSEIEKLGTGTTFKEVSGTTVANVAIPLPPLSEQQAIVEKLSALLAEIDALENA